MIVQGDYTKSVSQRVQREKLAVEMLSVIHELFYDRGVEVVIFRNQLRDKNTSEILDLHNYAKDFVGKPVSIEQTTEMLRALKATAIECSKLDLGKLTFEWMSSDQSAEEFIMDTLGEFFTPRSSSPQDVVLFGFGRIGRLLARELVAQEGTGQQLRLRAVAVRSIDETSLRKRASLLKIDSVHGTFPGSVEVDVERMALVVNGRPIFFIPTPDPTAADYTQYGIDNALLIDNSGAFRDKEALGKHLQGKGIAKVLLTAPGKGIPNIVHGVNHEGEALSGDILSAASCTTNAISPVLAVVENTFGIEKGHIETIHAYTNDQNLVDNMHKKYRRGRAAAMNMVITETGAGKAVDKCIPGLGAKLTSNAIRVPVPNGSLAILNLTLNKETTTEAFNEAMKQAALEGPLVEQINYSTNAELVSSDIVGNPSPSIFDSHATIVHADGKSVVMYVWYDNEYGYSRQVIRLAKYATEVRRPSYY